MPLYEYECLECGAHFEKLQRFGDPDVETCPNGHSKVHRLLGQPAIIFKGKGFYVTDNKNNGKRATSGGSTRKPKETESTAKVESEPSKPEAAAESSPDS